MTVALLIFSSPTVGDDTNNGSDPNKLKKLFSDHTIHYIDKESGKQHSIYFGRFGDFEKYFPCEYVDGTWWINEQGALCLKYSAGDQDPSCNKPVIDGSKVTLSSSTSETLLVAKIFEGNKLPFG